MDKKHYEQLKPVNEHLAITAPEHWASNDIAVICGVSRQRGEELIAHLHNLKKDDNNLKTSNTREKILLCSKVTKTPGELAFLAYKTAEFDILTNPSQLVARMTNLDDIAAMTPKERDAMVEKIVERSNRGDVN
jgi:hypothetical protein